jgi:hypothetical protein
VRRSVGQGGDGAGQCVRRNIVSVASASSTYENWIKSFRICSSIANALPAAESIENVRTKLPCLVNSTISLVPAVVFVTVVGSAFAVIKSTKHAERVMREGNLEPRDRSIEYVGHEELSAIILVVNRHAPRPVDFIRCGQLSYQVTLVVDDQQGPGLGRRAVRVAGGNRAGKHESIFGYSERVGES